MDIIKSILLGIIEGVTEWLPISSAGHLILADEFIRLEASDAFMEMFNVVIQLGAILAVVVLFWKKLWPFAIGKNQKDDHTEIVCGCLKKDIMELWMKVIVAMLPAAIIGIPLDDFLEAHLHTPTVIALALIVYGILFIVIEAKNRGKTAQFQKVSDLSYVTVFLIGVFQALSLIPGTSRSGSTILGAMILGASRVAAAEFSFYLAVPVMFGASFIKMLKFGFHFTSAELSILLVGMITAFLVSVLVIRFLMSYIKKRDFSAFGYYRIALGILVLVYFAFAS